MFALFSDLAGSAGSSLAQLSQVLILTGSIFEYLQFEDEQHFDQFVSAARRSTLADDVDEENPMKSILMSLSRTQTLLVNGRTRNRAHIEGSELMKVRLPPSFVRRIDLYRKLTKASRSAILTRLFERGIFLYIRSQRALVRAIIEATQTKEQWNLKKNGQKTIHKPAEA